MVPGVGSFSVVPKIEAALGGKGSALNIGIPALCICLGMQAMFESSEECGSAEGLGIIPGRVERLGKGAG